MNIDLLKRVEDTPCVVLQGRSRAAQIVQGQRRIHDDRQIHFCLGLHRLYEILHDLSKQSNRSKPREMWYIVWMCLAQVLYEPSGNIAVVWLKRCPALL